jgi:hypothetical protein
MNTNKFNPDNERIDRPFFAALEPCLSEWLSPEDEVAHADL